MIRGNRGNTVIITPIIWCLTLFVFILFLVLSIRILEPFIIYQKISETSLKYLFIVEEFGCLAKEDKENMINELVNKGLDESQIKISAPETPKEYGEVIGLDVEYVHKIKFPYFNKSGITPTFADEEIKVCISKQGISKC